MTKEKGYSTTVKQLCTAGLEHTLNIVGRIELPRVFKGHLFMPAVVETRDTVGEWPYAGSHREVVFSDGSLAREYIHYFEPPFFIYTVRFKAGLFAHLVDHIEGFWSFSPTGDGQTMVRWEYEFYPRFRFLAPIVCFVTKCLWPAYMRKGLDNCVRAAET